MSKGRTPSYWPRSAPFKPLNAHHDAARQPKSLGGILQRLQQRDGGTKRSSRRTASDLGSWEPPVRDSCRVHTHGDGREVAPSLSEFRKTRHGLGRPRSSLCLICRSSHNCRLSCFARLVGIIIPWWCVRLAQAISRKASTRWLCALFETWTLSSRRPAQHGTMGVLDVDIHTHTLPPLTRKKATQPLDPVGHSTRNVTQISKNDAVRVSCAQRKAKSPKKRKKKNQYSYPCGPVVES